VAASGSGHITSGDSRVGNSHAEAIRDRCGQHRIDIEKMGHNSRANIMSLDLRQFEHQRVADN
jgi:hypothetical protein